jgi:hypothetical protein
MEYYREWDRQYDAARAQAEDARLLAYERKNPPQSPDSPQASAPASTLAAPPSTEDPTAPTYVVLREVTSPSFPATPVTSPALSQEGSPLLFRYSDGEKALAAAKSAVRTDPSLRLRHTKLPDGSDCFELHRDGKPIERHMVGPTK